MFEVGWTEMLVIAIVMIVVVGPKDLPRMLRTIGKFTGRMRSMAGEFRKQFDEALKEAELDEVKKTVDSARSLNPAAQIRKALNPMEKAAQDLRSGVDQMMKPKPADMPKASDGLQASEPVKGPVEAAPPKPEPAKAKTPDKTPRAAKAPAAAKAAAAPKAKAAPKAASAKPAARKTSKKSAGADT